VLDLSGGTASYDVLAQDQPWLAEFTNTGNIRPIDDYLAKEDPFFASDFVENVVTAQVKGSDGQTYGAPLIRGVQLLAYRKDLFDQEAVNYKAQTGNDLKPPSTWREFADISKYFTRSMNPKSPTLYGVSLVGTKGNPALNMIQPLIWGFGREFDESYNVTVSNPTTTLQGWNVLGELVAYAQPSVGGDDWDGMVRHYEFGDAVMMNQWDSLIAPVELSDSPIKGKSGYAVSPGQTGAMGGWAFDVNKNSQKADVAWEFVRWATGPEFARMLALEGGVPARYSVMNDPELQQQIPYMAADLESLKVGQKRASACRECPGLVPESQYEDIVGNEASALINGQKSPQQAADAAAQGLTKLLQDYHYAS
jgi:multiple sugar transport system substrate-binding protein